MKGYNSKEAMAGHEYNMSSKHRKRESEGMKRYWEKEKGEGRKESKDRHSDDEVLKHNNKRMYGVNTMSEDSDIGKIRIKPTTLRGQPPQAWDYDY